MDVSGEADSAKHKIAAADLVEAAKLVVFRHSKVWRSLQVLQVLNDAFPSCASSIL